MTQDDVSIADAMANDLQPKAVSEDTLKRDDALLDLMAGWYRYARDAQNILRAFLMTHTGFNSSATGEAGRISVECDRLAFAALCKLAGRQLPALGEDPPTLLPDNRRDGTPFRDFAQSVDVEPLASATSASDGDASLSAPQVAADDGDHSAATCEDSESMHTDLACWCQVPAGVCVCGTDECEHT